MMLTIKIKMDNDAFEWPESEIPRILEIISQDFREGYHLETYKRTLMDANGNAVGKAEVTGKR